MEGDKDEQSSTLPEEQQQAQKTPEKSSVTEGVGEETTPTKTATPTNSTTPAAVSPPTSAAISVSRVNVAPSVNDSNNKNSIDVEVGNSVLEPAVGITAAVSTRGRDVEVDTLTESHPSSAENTRLRRKWEFFPGKNHFYCDGRVMTAPSIRFCMLSFALILLTFVLFIIFDAPFLTERLSVAIPIVGSILFVSVIVNMIKTSFSDPGILPRASQQEADYLEKSYYNTVQRPPPRTKDIIVNGQVIKSKYCFTCKMFRPPRASHCSVCDNCVDRFDHHCPFLGNCIGKRNYRSFYTFIVSLSFLAVFVLSASIAHLAMLSKERGNFLEALRDSPGSAVVIIISFFGMWTVLGLSGFHTYLIAVEQTTNEDIKGLFGRANAKNPFSHGNFCQNCCFVLCGPSQPSLIDPRGFATAEFIEALPRKSDPNGMLSSGQMPQQNMVKPNPTINNCSNDQQQGPGPSVSYVGVTSGGATKIYREHPPPAAPNIVQPIQHQPLHMSTSQSSTSELNNGGLMKSGFPSLPSIPPEEKILIKGQTRNGRPADFRQTIPESSALEEMSPEEMLISPSAASTVSLSTVSTVERDYDMSSSNDYDTVSSPQGRGGAGAGRVTTGASSSSVRLSQQGHYQRNSRNVGSTKRLFPSKSSDHLEGIVDPSDFDDDLDMPSLTNLNEDRGGGRRGVTNNFRGATSNANNNGPVSNNGLTKSTRSLPSTSAGSIYQDPNEINKIHVLESYPSSSKSSVCSKAPSTARKFGNSNGNSGRQVGNKRGLESTMQNSPLHLDTIM